MNNRRLTTAFRTLALAAAASAIATPAMAADAVTDALQKAYVPYRTALFRTNSKAQAESEQAIAQARIELRQIQERFASKPPAPYDRDTAFDKTLQEVAAVLAQSESQIRMKRLQRCETHRHMHGEVAHFEADGSALYVCGRNAGHAAGYRRMPV